MSEQLKEIAELAVEKLALRREETIGSKLIVTRACEEAWESGYQTAYGIVLKQMNELQQLRDKHEEAKGAYKAEIKSHARTEKMRKQAIAEHQLEHDR